MVASEKEIFEKVLKECGFEIESYDDGLYEISHRYSSLYETIQTKGYNLLYCLKRLTNTELTLEVLR